MRPLLAAYTYRCNMGNKANKGSKVKGVAQPAGAAGATAQAAQVLVMHVAPGKVYRGARMAWYTAALAYNGQPVAAYLAHCAEKPPSLPKSGVAEKPQGWLSWFVRAGVVTIAA